MCYTIQAVLAINNYVPVIMNLPVCQTIGGKTDVTEIYKEYPS